MQKGTKREGAGRGGDPDSAMLGNPLLRHRAVAQRRQQLAPTLHAMGAALHRFLTRQAGHVVPPLYLSSRGACMEEDLSGHTGKGWSTYLPWGLFDIDANACSIEYPDALGSRSANVHAPVRYTHGTPAPAHTAWSCVELLESTAPLVDFLTYIGCVLLFSSICVPAGKAVRRPDKSDRGRVSGHCQWISLFPGPSRRSNPDNQPAEQRWRVSDGHQDLQQSAGRWPASLNVAG